LPKATVDKGRNNSLDVAAGLRQHLDAHRQKGLFLWFGDGSTDQQAHTFCRKLVRSPLRLFDIEGHLSTAGLFPVLDVDNQHSAGHVKDGANSTFPIGYCNLHHRDTLSNLVPSQAENFERCISKGIFVGFPKESVCILVQFRIFTGSTQLHIARFEVTDE
jgi:hypothetical protein